MQIALAENGTGIYCIPKWNGLEDAPQKLRDEFSKVTESQALGDFLFNRTVSSLSQKNSLLDASQERILVMKQQPATPGRELSWELTTGNRSPLRTNEDLKQSMQSNQPVTRLMHSSDVRIVTAKTIPPFLRTLIAPK
jgi:hypothetical protein